MGRERSQLKIFAAYVGGNLVMQVEGVLDAWTYRQMRDAIVKAALDAPKALIIDVDKIEANDSSVWSVFTRGRWQASQADVPILLVCGDAATRRRLECLSVTLYVPVYATIREAREAVANSTVTWVRHVRLTLPGHPASVALAGEFVASELAAWSLADCVPAASVVTTLLVDNALRHGRGEYAMRLEADTSAVKVAIEDGSVLEAVRRPVDHRGGPAGLDVVAQLSTSWGNTPRPGGKTVWAKLDVDRLVDSR